ncbi:GNAT family N-acetyltransferase [Propionibacteriaceae bacterium G57]|uniref:GNAT family N-acetyltransferase n=1 Tax=Aestuariimicrobium sp. G57 TaxID=3418485 RepID=UPI003DA798D5
MTELDYRTAHADEWAQWRDLRLEMLEDEPIAFLQTLDDALATPDDVWRRRHADRIAAPDVMVSLVAVASDGRWRGHAMAQVDRFSTPRRCWLGAVYVGPEVRGSGVADRLVELAEHWALDQGFDRLLLEVHEHNARAIAFYLRRGYELTGEARPYPLNPDARELEMVKHFAGRG